MRMPRQRSHAFGMKFAPAKKKPSTIIQHTVWQLVFECVASPHIFLCHRTRGILVAPQLASFVCVLVSLVCQQPIRRLC